MPKKTQKLVTIKLTPAQIKTLINALDILESELSDDHPDYKLKQRRISIFAIQKKLFPLMEHLYKK